MKTLFNFTNKANKLKRFLGISLIAFSTVTPTCFAANTPAFPGAEGFGMYTTGGRGGTVYHVTSLKDDGSEGTLRYAVSKSGARTIVFDVSGIIELESRLCISNGDLTIAGQTAPGDGICIKNYEVYVGADNVILRFLRFRLGTDKPDGYNEDGTPYQDRDAIWGRNQSNIIIDHCSMSWCTDECASFYNNKNFTMQWCLIAESLRGSLHPKGYHGYGGIWGGQGASFHHNMLAHHDSRNPRICGSRYTNQPDLELVDIRNNVLYNWGSTNSGYAAEGGNYNFVNNYYKSGPATKESIKYRIFSPNADDGSNAQEKGIYGYFYVNGNYMYGKGANWDWDGIDIDNRNNSAMTKDAIKKTTEFAVSSVTTHTAETAFDKVITLAGASLKRDVVDSRIATEAQNGTTTYTGSVLGGKGIIDKPTDVGGWPTYNSTAAPTDTDQDGMPDEWETTKGLNPNDATDGAQTATDGSGYTNLELYINSLVCSIMVDGLSDALTSTNYTCEATVQDSAKLLKRGGGGSNQTLMKGSAIVDYYFDWENATTVTLTGNLPDGVEYEIGNNAQTISFSGVAYDEPGTYTATIKTIGGINEATRTISFTLTASTYNISKRKFDFILGVDGNFKTAIEKASTSRQTRFYIFIPNGTYDIGSLTGDDNQMTTFEAGTVSLIGQDIDGVTLYNKAINESIGTTATLYFTSKASNLYLQDLTLQNKGTVEAGAKAGRFVVVKDEGKKNIFKRVRLLSTQDTYYSRSDRTYWEESDIHGTVDFICGFGDILFNKCSIYLEYRTSSNVITAPGTSTNWGYVFKDCTIDGDDINNNKYLLGRPWNGTPKCVYINTIMKKIPAKAGWGDPMNVNPSVFAEYNSKDGNGNAIDVSGRRTSYTKDGVTVTLNPILSANDAAKYTVSNVVGGSDNWTPDNDCKQLSAPRIKLSDHQITWVHNDSALCYFIFKNNVYVTNTTENNYTIPSGASTSDQYTVRSANAMGGLGAISNSISLGTEEESDVTTDRLVFYYDNGTTSSTNNDDYNNRWNCTDNGMEGYGWAITGRTDKSILYGNSITYNGTTYSTFKNSNGAQNTFYLPNGVIATKITFIGYSNAEEVGYLTEINGENVSYGFNTTTSTTDYANQPSVVEYTFTNDVCGSFTYTISTKQVCFIIALEVQEGTCNATQSTEILQNLHCDECPIYDLFGRVVKTMERGKIYIQNGQRFLLK